MDINVTCEASKRLSVEELLEFQGELKTLHVKSYNRLKNSIMKYGFAFPMFIWKGKNYLLDGHQRLRVIKNERFNIVGGVPVVEIDAKTEKQAAELVLLASSAYGKETEQGLYEFTEKFNIDLRSWDLLEMPEIDEDRFRAAFYDDYSQPNDTNFKNDTINEETVGPAVSSAISQIILYFQQDEYTEIINSMENLIELEMDESIDDPSTLLLYLVRQAEETIATAKG